MTRPTLLRWFRPQVHRPEAPRRRGRGIRPRCRLEVSRLEDRSPPSFQVLATLGDPAPGGAGFRINDFEPGGLNIHGDVLYGNDLGTTSDPSSFYGEGITLRSQGQETLLARSGASAPGGGTFESTFLGPVTLNDHADAAFVFALQPFSFPIGVNVGVYRFSHTTQTVTPVVLPGATKVPNGGGTFS